MLHYKYWTYGLKRDYEQQFEEFLFLFFSNIFQSDVKKYLELNYMQHIL